ncbi:phosphoadenosine phosphosulfate reductase family protein [Actinomadura viridis]|uniref:phosphoadenosine phosphosulfate reductase domain-containing protein n=1 Tax=Actinomadura viridis TaxID=58110 RepID=UPI00369387B1
MNQLQLVDFTSAPSPCDMVRAADVIVVNSSAGKDSQAMLDYVAELAAEAGVSDRVTVVHNDLGTTDTGIPIEWPGTADLARRQAEHYGFPFVITRREKGGLYQQLRNERLKFPGPGLGRWCTSDQKTSQAMKVVTRLAKEHKRSRGLKVYSGEPVKVLYCLGLRAQESPGRARKPVIEEDHSAWSDLRTVTRWNPILHWTETEVWDRIKASGVPYHPAYDEGMTRLSCSLCVLASRDDLIRAARLRPDLAAEYAALETELDHQFRADMSMADIIAAASERQKEHS